MYVPERLKSDLYIMTRSGDYGFSQAKPYKRILLSNPQECKGLELLPLISAWCGTGHSEWEAILAAIFIGDVEQAIMHGEEEAEITNMFTHDLYASGDRVFTQAQIFNHIMKWFECLSETPQELRVRLKVRQK